MPNSAAPYYKAMDLLQIGSIVINSGGITGAVGSNGLHVNSYFGDVTGDGTITGPVGTSGTDVWTENKVATGSATGFSAFPLVDSLIMGDILATFSVDSTDVTALGAFVTNHSSTLQIPVPPGLTVANGNPPQGAPDGLLQAVISPLLRTTSFYFMTAIGRVSAVVDLAGLRTAFGYDGGGNLATVTDSNGGITTTLYDAENRVTAVIEPSGLRTSYVYDSNGMLALSETDPTGLTTSYGYDSQGEQTEVIENLMALPPQEAAAWPRTTLYLYDVDGNQTHAVVDPMGFSTDYKYDAVNRLTAASLRPRGRLQFQGLQPTPMIWLASKLR